MTLPVLKFKLVGEGAKLPTKQRKSDAGIDIYTNILYPVTLTPGSGHKFSTGIKAEIPPGYCVLLWDRSGIGSQFVVKCAGVIDQEYRGEWFVTLVNLGHSEMTISPGDKIIQGILTPVVDCEIRDVDAHPEENGTLSETERGEKGHGSSGTQ